MGNMNTFFKRFKLLEYVLSYLRELITKKQCSICGKREKFVILYHGQRYCVECWKRMNKI